MSPRTHRPPQRTGFGMSAGPWRAALLALLVTLLVAAACSADDGADTAGADGEGADGDTAEETVQEGPPDVPPPSEPGPYAVGRSVVEFRDDDRDRPLVTDVWYPVDPGADGEPSVYEFIPGLSFESELALADVPVSGDGPFPLVVYSHGSGGLRYVASFFTELLASHGVVVASSDHVGNTAAELITDTGATREENALNRVLDVERLIGAVVDQAAAGEGPVAGAVDAERVGVTGHSFGAFTALASVSGYENDLGSAPPDDRVDAVVAMAPASGLLSDEELAAVDVPTLLLSGTEDVTTPVDPDTERPWELIEGRPLWRVDITDGGHQSFTDVCTYQEVLPDLGAPQLLIDAVDDYAEEGCTDELVSIDTAHDLINDAAVSFLLAELAGRDDYVWFLEDEAEGETVSVRE